MFAIGPGVPNNGCVLLGFSPFEQEDDLSAAQHTVYLKSLLPYYACSLDDILYFVGDNCSTNCKLANDLNIPIIGCNSHKLNLAVLRFMGMNQRDQAMADANCTQAQLDRRQLLHLLSALMSKLKTIKGKAKLHEYTDWVGVKANETRWNGNFVCACVFCSLKMI